MAKPPIANTFARGSAVLALVVVAIEAAVASLMTLVPALATLGSKVAPWVLVAVPALAVLAGLFVLGGALEKRARSAVPAVVVVAVALGALMGALGALSPSLRGAGLAFAAPLLAGEIFAAGAWLAIGSERSATALSLLAAAVTTCAAAFLAERLDVEMAPLALGVAGVCAQLQLAVARVGEGGLLGGELPAAVGARFGAVPRSLVLAALGRSGPQGDA